MVIVQRPFFFLTLVGLRSKKFFAIFRRVTVVVRARFAQSNASRFGRKVQREIRWRSPRKFWLRNEKKKPEFRKSGKVYRRIVSWTVDWQVMNSRLKRRSAWFRDDSDFLSNIFTDPRVGRQSRLMMAAVGVYTPRSATRGNNIESIDINIGVYLFRH